MKDATKTGSLERRYSIRGLLISNQSGTSPSLSTTKMTVLQRGRRCSPAGRGLVERTNAWFHNFHRLRVRYQRLAKIHEAFLKFAACLIFWSALKRSIQPF
jgi:hypothetical protein